MLTTMPQPSITKILGELPFEKKLIGVGAILMVIGLFLPWYQDVDSFHTGDTFTGLTGPMYLVGLTFLVIASLSIMMVVMDYLDKKIPIFKIKTAQFHLWSGVASFYLLFVVGSVYFHQSFGVNITMKQSQFGMFMVYIAASLLTVGGYLAGRERKSVLKEFEKETRPNVVPAPAEHRKARDLNRTQPVPTPLQPAMDLKVEEPIMQSAPTPAPVQTQKNEPIDRTVQPYRMDL